jgi:subtilisin family serine protease
MRPPVSWNITLQRTIFFQARQQSTRLSRMVRRVIAGFVLAWGLIASPLAGAQIGVPGVRVPRLPEVNLPQVGQAAADLPAGLTSQALQDARRLTVRDLLRRHSDVVEADPRGAPIVRAEVLAFSPSDAVMDRIRAAGFQVVREDVVEGLDSRIVVLRPPPRTSTRRALQQLRAIDPTGSFDFNHIYEESGSITGSARARARAVAAADDAQGGGAPVASGTRVGLIDGGVNTDHTVFAGEAVHRHGCGAVAIPSAHGTEVASLMVGSSVTFHGAAPGAELYAADVYCGLATGGSVDSVAEAFGWLVKEHVPVINVSLVGPPNVLLENIVRMVIARGHLIVAAVGNDGPAAPPLYPAAYPNVIGVTAVDAKQRVLVEAGRGPHVKFAAPGADMSAADTPQTFAAVRGTSFAAPIVAGLLATELNAPDVELAHRAVDSLMRQAVDLGARGPDKIYGNGLVGATVRPQPALARIK